MKLLVLVCLLIAAANSGMFKLVQHSYERGAACLDGSPAGLYIHEGDPNRFMLYFDSGGFCGAQTLATTLQSCYQRSFGSLGSTAKAPAQKNLDALGLLSTQQEMNPVFYNWTKIFVIYCDGSEHQGTRRSPISYKDRDLYFRGLNNSMEQFYYLNKTYDFFNKEKIVITGVSAGGIATYLYSTYLFQNTKSSKVYAIPDSGLFLTDYQSPILHQKVIRERGQNLFKLVSDEGGFMFPQCVKKFQGDIVQCFNAANLAPYLKGPMLIVESPYDQYSINNIVVARCLTNKDCPYSLANCNVSEKAAIEDYRQETIKALYQLRNNRTDVGLWAPSCVQHGFTDTYSFSDPDFAVDGSKVDQAIAQFLSNPQRGVWRMDEGAWPSNSGCSGVSKKNKLTTQYRKYTTRSRQ